jgi:hypothetical protein
MYIYAGNPPLNKQAQAYTLGQVKQPLSREINQKTAAIWSTFPSDGHATFPFRILPT